MVTRPFVVLLFATSVFAAMACGGGSESGTVDVEIELQLINAEATVWSMGSPAGGGQGSSGFGASNETLRETVSLEVGQYVEVSARGTQFDSSTGSHELIGRILVDGEEIYLCADQGTPSEDTEIDCGGPVYLPNDDD